MPEHILVIRFGALGDIVLTTPFLRALRTHRPAATITFVTKVRAAPLLETNPHIDHLVPLGSGESIRRLVARLPTRTFDRICDLHDNIRSRMLRSLITGPSRTCRQYRWPRLRMILTKRDGHSLPPIAERFFDTVRDLTVKPDGAPAELFLTDADTGAAAERAAPPYVLLAPGASRPSKRWPARHWSDLADRLTSRGHRVVTVGSADDRGTCPSPSTTAVWDAPLRVAAALCRQADVAVTNDSFMLHAATAVDTPVVALFGPTSPRFGYAPYLAPGAVVEQPVWCRPCSRHGARRCPLGHHRCLEQIPPERVLRQVEAFL